MLQLVSFININKKCTLGYDHGADCKSVNDPHEVNEIDIVGIGNNNAGRSKDQQADQAQLISSKTIQYTSNKQLRDSIAD